MESKMFYLFISYKYYEFMQKQYVSIEQGNYTLVWDYPTCSRNTKYIVLFLLTHFQGTQVLTSSLL